MSAVRLDRWTVTSGSNVNSRAAVVIRGADHDWKASAEGNGPVDALYRAVDRALADVLGGDHPAAACLRCPRARGGSRRRGPGHGGHRAARNRAGDARTAGRYTGEATGTNTIAASVEAYLQAVNEMLGSDAWSGVTESAAEAAAARRARRRGGESPAGEVAAEFDDDARPIDTTEWFNR